jgi:predicted nucleotidyltransferase component of viral defense system
LRFFYLTGGTALAAYYLRHRLSEDLDFFAEKEFELKNNVLKT